MLLSCYFTQSPHLSCLIITLATNGFCAFNIQSAVKLVDNLTFFDPDGFFFTSNNLKYAIDWYDLELGFWIYIVKMGKLIKKWFCHWNPYKLARELWTAFKYLHNNNEAQIMLAAFHIIAPHATMQRHVFILFFFRLSYFKWHHVFVE